MTISLPLVFVIICGAVVSVELAQHAWYAFLNSLSATAMAVVWPIAVRLVLTAIGGFTFVTAINRALALGHSYADQYRTLLNLFP